jgi:hypothetical protein
LKLAWALKTASKSCPWIYKLLRRKTLWLRSTSWSFEYWVVGVPAGLRRAWLTRVRSWEHIAWKTSSRALG